MDLLFFKKISTVLVIIFASFLISIGAEYLLSIPEDAHIISTNWQVVSPEKSVSKSIPNTFIIDVNGTPNFSEGLYSLSGKVYIDKTINRASLVLTQQPNHGFRIWIDDKFIAQVGDLKAGQANIWGGSGYFPIPLGILRGEHKVQIDIYAVENLSLLTSPYIVDINKHEFKYLGIKIMNNYVVNFIMGITFTLGILFISLGFIDRKKERLRVLLGIAFLLMSGFFIDFISNEILLIPYLLYKKLILSCLSFGFIITYVVIISTLDEKIVKRRIIYILLLVLIGFLLIFMPNTLALLNNSSLLITIVGIVVYISVLMHPKLKFWKINSINFIVVGIISLSFFTIRFLYYSLLKVPHTDLVHLGVFIYIISLFLYFVSDYMKQSKEIVVETSRADHYFNKSVIDPLTNVNNRHILSYINLESSSFVLFICDLDNFKTINDDFGHKAGDQVLMKFCYLIKRFIRESDYIIRLGGDEFAIILTGCSGERGEEIGFKIWDAINEETVKVDNIVFNFSASGGGVESLPGEDFDRAMRRADKNLYIVKEEKKGFFKFT